MIKAIQDFEEKKWFRPFISCIHYVVIRNVVVMHHSCSIKKITILILRQATQLINLTYKFGCKDRSNDYLWRILFVFMGLKIEFIKSDYFTSFCRCQNICGALLILTFFHLFYSESQNIFLALKPFNSHSLGYL